jgi:hypothetical protein
MMRIDNKIPCEHLIGINSECALLAKVKITHPYPDNNYNSAKYLCYSHLMTYAKRATGQFLVEGVK